MSNFNPCIEHCFIKYGKQYDPILCSNCDHAKIAKELNKYKKFKEYFDDLCGQGLEIANWHLNGDTEPYESFYDRAIEFMEG